MSLKKLPLALALVLFLVMAISGVVSGQYNTNQVDPISNSLEASNPNIGIDEKGNFIIKPTIGDQISNLPEASKPIMWIDKKGNLVYPNDHFTVPEGQTDNAFHIAVIGDSIAWGNGLNQKDKYYHQVAEWLQEALNRPVDVTVYAHSGAHISGENGKSIDSNLNSDYPTLMEQVDNIQNADDVDLILTSGGLNDVDIMKILNVSTPAEEIDQRAQSIKDPMKNLLSSLLSKCKNAKIIVTTYYPIVSDDSDVTVLALAYGTGVFIIDNVLNKNILDAATDAATIKERLTENSYMFQGGTTTALTNAVLETNNGANRIALAVINFKDSNSYAASDTWLWKLETVAPPKTDDDFYEERVKLCKPIDITNIADKDNYINYINAMGHPNVKGANEYTRAIKMVIEGKGLKWLDNSPPTAQAFQVTPLSINSGGAFKIDYTISDSSGSGLKQVELWRKDGTSDWQEIKPPNTLSDENGPLSGSFTDSPAASGKYWYGVHVVDNAGNWNDQKNSNTNGLPSSFEPVEVNVKGAATAEASSQAPSDEWNRTFGGVGEDRAHSVQPTSDGGYILAGETSSSIGGASDALLIKTDSQGNEVWSRTFGGADSDRAESVQLTPDGGYVLAGSTASFSSGGTDTELANSDAWLIKTDSQGNEIWSKTFGGLNVDQAHSVQPTLDGGYIIAGETESFSYWGRDALQALKQMQSEGSSWPTPIHIHPWDGRRIIDSDAWLIKTDVNGNELWNRTFGLTDYDGPTFDWPNEAAYSVQVVSDGGYILVGAGWVWDGAWLIKTDSQGNELWNKTFGGLNVDQASSVQPTPDGGYILAGGWYSADAWLIKTDANGNKLWNKTFDNGWASSVQPTSDGGYILASGDLLIKTDSQGNELWNRTFGGADSWVESVQLTSDGGYILSGSTAANTDNWWDAWLIKVAPA